MLLLAFFISCHDTKPIEKAKPLPPRPISSIKLFLDNSESNMGYLKGDTRYKVIVDELIANLEDKPKQGMNFYYISDSVYTQHCNGKQFIDILANGNIRPVTTCSEMHHMMDMLTSQLDSNDIGILVSDCILSFCDVKDNPEKNRDNAESQLKTSVKTVFNKLSRNGICASVYGFKSSFTGRYFTYNNAWKNYTRETRPFYVWFIGHRDQLNQLNRELQKDNAFQTSPQLHFGFNNEPLEQYDLFFSTGKKGNCRVTTKGVTEIETTPGKPVTFVMGINLQKLPPYAQTTEYIRNNISINFHHLKLTGIKQKEGFALAKENNKEKLIKENNTHFLYFELDDLIKDTSVEITIDNKTDNWYEEWSTMDDKTREENKEKTFALVHLINGVKESFEVKNAPFFKIKLPLTK